jgi:ATP-dependent phosphofructokinase / diphosphate-dependent phosphofructokinase
MRLGVLTSGGDCPGLNAVIRAVVKTATGVYGDQVMGFQDGFLGLLNEGVRRPLSSDDVKGVLALGGTILGTTNKGPFNLDCDGKAAAESLAFFQECADNWRTMGLNCLIAIGGDGSLKIARVMQCLGVNIIGVPKTIDNDLEATERTFGFDTAVSIATESLDRLHTTAAAHHRVMVCEVMGRDAGWIAIHAGLASGADAILIPEIPFSWSGLATMISRRSERGRLYSLVVVAEGAKPKGGPQIHGQGGRLGGIGQAVADEVARLTGQESRATVLGHVQRGGTPTPFDRVLASRYGEAAVHLAHRGKYDTMVALRADEIVAVPLESAIAANRRVPVDGELVRLCRNTGVCFGDEA